MKAAATLGAVVWVAITSAVAAQSGAVDNAYRLCAMFDATGLTSEKCSVSGWHSTIDVSIDMRSAEARILCAKVADHASQSGMKFDGKWKIQIKSPFSGGRPVAFCLLR